MPDGALANAAGCKCPTTNAAGAGRLVDHVREWDINPLCPIHSDPQWWYGPRKKTEWPPYP